MKLGPDCAYIVKVLLSSDSDGERIGRNWETTVSAMWKALAIRCSGKTSRQHILVQHRHRPPISPLCTKLSHSVDQSKTPMCADNGDIYIAVQTESVDAEDDYGRYADRQTGNGDDRDGCAGRADREGGMFKRVST